MSLENSIRTVTDAVKYTTKDDSIVSTPLPIYYKPHEVSMTTTRYFEVKVTGCCNCPIAHRKDFQSMIKVCSNATYFEAEKSTRKTKTN